MPAILVAVAWPVAPAAVAYGDLRFVQFSIDFLAMDKTAALMRKLDHQFADQDLLQLALTHRSRGSNYYERLEFLGDSILGFVVAEWLYKNFPDVGEGRLSRMRSSLVRKETLAQVARDIQLGDYLLLGEGEMKSGGFHRESILSDTVESLIGAIYLDSDFSAARKFIFAKFEQQFEAVAAQTSFKDAKSELQEAMQKWAMKIPSYSIVETTGEQHRQEFSVECSLSDLPIKATACAGNRRLAEQKSAALVLQQLQEIKPFKKKPLNKKV